MQTRRASTTRLFKAWFWRPPRPHGEAIHDRRVSPLELLYDLVFAAAIAQSGRHLGTHVSAGGLFEFAAVFSLIWMAWTNGTLYLELHGRKDGRTRTWIFIQIGILAIIAAFTGGGAGAAFALAYAAFLVVMTWLWYEVRLQDVAAERLQFLQDTGRYVIAMSASVLVMLATVFLPGELRIAVWALLAAAWIVLISFLGRSPVGLGQGMAPTDSLVDRFGTFTLIVLGEVVFGVVAGLAESPHDALTVATAMIALVIGFGFWWIYFDVVGGRRPKGDGGSLANWILSHYPIALSIAAAGEGMVGLLDHAHDESTPAATAWLLSSAVAVGMIAVIVTMRAIADARLAGPYRVIAMAMAAGAVISIAVGWARPAPWLLALLLMLVLGLVWAVAVREFLVAGAWEAETEAG